MSVAGSCEICQTGRVAHTCDRCGNLVCSEHFEKGLGLCVECAAEVTRNRGQGESREDERGEDGTDTYRF